MCNTSAGEELQYSILFVREISIIEILYVHADERALYMKSTCSMWVDRSVSIIASLQSRKMKIGKNLKFKYKI